MPDWRQGSLTTLKLFQHLFTVLVIGVQLDGLFVIPDRELLFAFVHVGFAHAVVGVIGVGVILDVVLEEVDGAVEIVEAELGIAAVVDEVLGGMEGVAEFAG